MDDSRDELPDTRGAGGATVTQQRIVIEVDDLDRAMAFYRDQLGLPEEFFVDSGNDARVVALQAGRATLELVTPDQVPLVSSRC